MQSQAVSCIPALHVQCMPMPFSACPCSSAVRLTRTICVTLVAPHRAELLVPGDYSWAMNSCPAPVQDTWMPAWLDWSKHNTTTWDSCLVQPSNTGCPDFQLEGFNTTTIVCVAACLLKVRACTFLVPCRRDDCLAAKGHACCRRALCACRLTARMKCCQGACVLPACTVRMSADHAHDVMRGCVTAFSKPGRQ